MQRISIVWWFCPRRDLGQSRWMQGEWSGKEGLGLEWGVREMSRVNINGEFSTEYIQFSIAMIIKQTVTVTVKCNYKYLK